MQNFLRDAIEFLPILLQGVWLTVVVYYVRTHKAGARGHAGAGRVNRVGSPK